MAVGKDGDRRWVSVEAEVSGAAADVWEAIATGQGITSWFVPSEVDGRIGGKTVCNFGPGMDSVAEITEWEPPLRFVATSADLGEGAPPVITEWSVEAGDGGRCVVRVVHSLTTDSDEWDGAMEMWESGWPNFFRILAVYCEHFLGQAGSPVQVMGTAPEPASRAWSSFCDAAALAVPNVGGRCQTGPNVPPLGGIVLATGSGEDRELLVRLDQPTTGIAHAFALPMGGQVYLGLRQYLFGADAAAIAKRQEAAWQAWMVERFGGG
jgi:uncharacterized protein YndB with AHSA1/START domain